MSKNNEESFLERIKRNKKNSWPLGNEVLYRLCRKYPFHKTDDEIGAKIWLIGRAYAATIERRKKYLNMINDDFFNKKVFPNMKKIGGIDSWINDCKKQKTVDSYLIAHKYLTDLFKKISGLKKRSLASKYLHFHLPNSFFIYDSRATKSINILLNKLNTTIMKSKLKLNKFDRVYAEFYYKCLEAQKAIQKKFNIYLKCRELDTLLLDIGNENLRK